MTAPLRFRPHHFLCALGYEGKGYSDAFTANMSAIVMGRLRSAGGDGVEIVVAAAADDICAPCPKRRDQLCSVQAKIDRLDASHGAALGFSAGDRLSWGEAKARIRARVAAGSLHDLCAGCEWEPLGLCEAALARLHADRAK